MSETLELLKDLISRESVTPEDAGCQDVLAVRLTRLGFKEERLNFEDTQNIWLRRGDAKPLFTFLGHTDVVPSGPLDSWLSPPFVPTICDGKLYGRGAADMKGGIACFITAVERFIARYPGHQGSIAVMMTSDEEGIATNGVVKVIEVLEQRNEKIDWCLVGEPSSDKKIGKLADFEISKGELSAFFRQKGHKNYRECGDQVIRNFLTGLTIRFRKSD